jgi:hypothetical protein
VPGVGVDDTTDGSDDGMLLGSVSGATEEVNIVGINVLEEIELGRDGELLLGDTVEEEAMDGFDVEMGFEEG